MYETIINIGLIITGAILIYTGWKIIQKEGRK